MNASTSQQTRNALGVREERTGWRDETLSARHRLWGFDCPMADIDMFACEYHTALPVAFVEYKLYTKHGKISFRHPSILALAVAAERAELPFWVAFYWPEAWTFKIYPVGALAEEWFAVGEDLSEEEYVRRLYRMRGLVVEQRVIANLMKRYPDEIDPGAQP